MFAFALRWQSGGRAQAEDLVQEVYLRAFRSYKTMRAPQKFKSWLFPILVKAHINDFHWQSREALFVDVELSDVALDQLGSDWIQTPDERFFDQVLDSEVQQALDALPVKFRAVVWLFDAEELS